MQKNNRKRAFKSVDEFKSIYFPESYKKDKIMNSDDPKELGILFAKKSLQHIQNNL
jgi:hypothetical protein